MYSEACLLSIPGYPEATCLPSLLQDLLARRVQDRLPPVQRVRGLLVLLRVQRVLLVLLRVQRVLLVLLRVQRVRVLLVLLPRGPRALLQRELPFQKLWFRSPVRGRVQPLPNPLLQDPLVRPLPQPLSRAPGLLLQAPLLRLLPL